MFDLENMAQGAPEKLAYLNKLNVLCIDRDSGSLCEERETAISLTTKEFQTIRNHYKRYNLYLREGGSCKRCTEQKMKNEVNNYEDFLLSLYRKYLGGV